MLLVLFNIRFKTQFGLFNIGKTVLAIHIINTPWVAKLNRIFELGKIKIICRNKNYIGIMLHNNSGNRKAWFRIKSNTVVMLEREEGWLESEQRGCYKAVSASKVIIFVNRNNFKILNLTSVALHFPRFTNLFKFSIRLISWVSNWLCI